MSSFFLLYQTKQNWTLCPNQLESTTWILLSPFWFILLYPYLHPFFCKHASFQDLWYLMFLWRKLRSWEMKLSKITLNWLVSPCNCSILLLGIKDLAKLNGAKLQGFGAKLNGAKLSTFMQYLMVLNCKDLAKLNF